MAEEKNFETKMTELETIVKRLEQGDVPLEEALAKFKDGVTLAQELQLTLQEAEDTLTQVMTPDGQLKSYEPTSKENKS